METHNFKIILHTYVNKSFRYLMITLPLDLKITNYYLVFFYSERHCSMNITVTKKISAAVYETLQFS